MMVTIKKKSIKLFGIALEVVILSFFGLIKRYLLTQVCSVWLPVDPVSEHTCLRLVKGSHKFPHYFKPVHFDGPPFMSYETKPGKEKRADEFLSTPDVDGNDQYQVLSWNMEVG